MGEDFQRKMEEIIVGIVGLGGTGSCVVEQLSRQGVKHFLIVDHDKFEHSNLTRVYGSKISDTKKRA
jgi:tRNA A37 threonylcarbamoyladenosine dehydratase